MKKTYLLALILTLTLTSVLAQLQKPQWEMPFYFEDAEGAKDTIWVGYDPEAKPSIAYDTLFEKYQWIDTSKFNTVIFYGLPSPISGKYVLDSANKIIVSSFTEELFVGIDFIKGKLPLKISWPDSLLNSDSLPFPDLSPGHRAKAWIPNSLGIAYPDPFVPCSFSGYFTIVSDTDYVEGDSECMVWDSLVLTSPDNDYYTAGKGIGGINLYIVPQNRPTGVGIEEKDRDLISCFPNPFDDKISIKNMMYSELELTLYNVFARELERYSIKKGEAQKELYLGHLSAGVYFLKVKSQSGRSMHRLVKTM